MRYLSAILRWTWVVLTVLGGGALVAQPAELGSENGRILERGPCFTEPSYEALIESSAAQSAARAGTDAQEMRRALRARWPEDAFRFLSREVAGEPGCQRIVYSSDGLRVAGYLLRPGAVAAAGARAPVVLFNRGGNREFGKLREASLFRLAGLAQRGYAVLASQYRGNDGGEGQEEFGGAEVADVLHLIPLAESLPYADSERIGMFGWSRGGMMTYLALQHTDRIRAAVVGAGAADAFASVKNRPAMEEHVYSQLVPNWGAEREAALAARSAVRWADRLHKRTPILLLHGSADWRVHPTQALDMARALYEVRHPFRLVFLEGGDHGLTEFREEVNEMIYNWFDRYLRDGEAWPSLEPHGR